MLWQPPTLDEHELSACKEIESQRRTLEPGACATWVRPLWSGRLWRLMLAHATSARQCEGLVSDTSLSALDASTLARTSDRCYRRAMRLVLRMASDPAFTYSVDVLKHVHHTLLSYDVTKAPGRVRRGAVSVYASNCARYRPPPPADVPTLLSELVAVLNEPGDTPLVVRAAMGHLNLALIHPFDDANGRLARCLHVLILARGGPLSSTFCSLDEYLGHFTQRCSDLLYAVSGGLWAPSRDSRPWVRFCLRGHLWQAYRIAKTMENVRAVGRFLEEAVAAAGVSMAVMPLLIDATFKPRVLAPDPAHLHDVARILASDHLRAAIQAGLLVERGSTRQPHYVAAERLIQTRIDVMSRTSAFVEPFALDEQTSATGDTSSSQPAVTEFWDRPTRALSQPTTTDAQGPSVAARLR